MSAVKKVVKKVVDVVNPFSVDVPTIEPEAMPNVPSPTDEETALELQAAAQEERRKRNKGKASTILAGGLQDDNLTSASRTLLG